MPAHLAASLPPQIDSLISAQKSRHASHEQRQRPLSPPLPLPLGIAAHAASCHKFANSLTKSRKMCVIPLWAASLAFGVDLCVARAPFLLFICPHLHPLPFACPSLCCMCVSMGSHVAELVDFALARIKHIEIPFMAGIKVNSDSACPTQAAALDPKRCAHTPRRQITCTLH